MPSWPPMKASQAARVLFLVAFGGGLCMPRLCGGLFGRRLPVARSQDFFHDNDVAPGAEFPAAGTDGADLGKAERAMHAHRAGIGRVADDGHGLAYAHGFKS